MEYEEAKKRFMLHLRYTQVEIHGDYLSRPAQREYQRLFAEFGEPEYDSLYEDMDAISAHLAGCLDPAPQWVCDEVSGLADGGTWHAMYVKRMTNWLMELGDKGDEASVVRLYKVYCKDLMMYPDVAPSRKGFQSWVAAMVDEDYVNDLMSRLPEDLAAVPSSPAVLT
jgi:hypothetical protein